MMTCKSWFSHQVVSVRLWDAMTRGSNRTDAQWLSIPCLSRPMNGRSPMIAFPTKRGITRLCQNLVLCAAFLTRQDRKGLRTGKRQTMENFRRHILSTKSRHPNGDGRPRMHISVSSYRGLNVQEPSSGSPHRHGLPSLT